MSEPATTKLCPTCGTRVSESATRCLVCGATLTSGEKASQPEPALRGSRMPEITLSLPAIIVILVVFLAIGAVLAYVGLRRKPEAIGFQPLGTVIPPTATATVTRTPTQTGTPAPPTSTFTPEPSPTPMEYTVQEGDTCLGIAAFFKISMQSIVSLNNLGTTGCASLAAGRKLQIPQPTPTSTGLPTATLGAAEETRAACETVDYMVQEGDTLGKIAASYNLPMEAIRSWNGLPGNNVLLGTNLIIPLCMRNATPGPTATPTPPPPYPAPNLLLPANGAPFNSSDNTITLQWASVGTLRDNEGYMVKVEDQTDTKNQMPAVYVTDTKYIVPASFRPKDNRAHVFSWTVVVVRQSGNTDESGNPIWDIAGAASAPRLFSWIGTGGVAPAPSPTPAK
jgi:LysM repeat protein